MRLTLIVEFEDGNGSQMEDRLNKAIDSEALIKKGVGQMELDGYEMSKDGGDPFFIYRVTITPSQ
jgi:hypothetical protein